MALRIIEGVPGSGKTYYAVHHLVRSYFKWDDETDRYVSNGPVRVVSNIERFSMSESLDDEIAKAGGLDKFFNVDYQRGVAPEGTRVVYVIDEAQKYFGRQCKLAGAFFYFQYHRHLGHDVYLVTQDVKTLALELRHLAEYVIRATRRVYSVMGEFRYRFYGNADDRVSWKTKVLKRDPRIFGLYSSMVSEESEKLSSAPMRFLVKIVAMLVVAAVLFVWVLHSWAARSKTAVEPYVGVGVQRQGEREVEREERRERLAAARTIGEDTGLVPAAERIPPDPSRERVTLLWIVGDVSRGRAGLMNDAGDEYILSQWELAQRCLCVPWDVETGGVMFLRVTGAAYPPLPERARSASVRQRQEAAARPSGMLETVGQAARGAVTPVVNYVRNGILR